MNVDIKCDNVYYYFRILMRFFFFFSSSASSVFFNIPSFFFIKLEVDAMPFLSRPPRRGLKNIREKITLIRLYLENVLIYRT